MYQIGVLRTDYLSFSLNNVLILFIFLYHLTRRVSTGVIMEDIRKDFTVIISNLQTEDV